MPQLAIVNMFIGFLVIFISASAGSFIAFDLTEAFVKNQEFLLSWELILKRSAHGHFNLFGLIHIVFGLTLSYSKLPNKVKKLQTLALGMGTLAMGPGLLLRAHQGPSLELDVLAVVVGTCACFALLAIVSHAFGLYVKLTSF